MTNINPARTITIINCADGSVEAHRPGCRDIARKVKAQFPFADTFEFKVTSQRHAFLEYNADFIDEEPDESTCYPISFYPCLTLPEND